MSEASADRQGRDPAPAVTRSMAILGLLAEAPGPLTLTEIANALGLAKSSTANLCLALEAAMMVQRVPLGYQLGRRTVELGGAFAAQFNQIREFYGVCAASPVLVHEVVQVVMLDERDALYLARHEGSRSVRFGTPLGSRLPAALSATGNALLMPMEDAEVTALLADSVPFPRLTEHSVRDLPSLLDEARPPRASGVGRSTTRSRSPASSVSPCPSRGGRRVIPGWRSAWPSPSRRRRPSASNASRRRWPRRRPRSRTR